ncbi:AAA ATPase [Savitreella phatthalungensis]
MPVASALGKRVREVPEPQTPSKRRVVQLLPTPTKTPTKQIVAGTPSRARLSPYSPAKSALRRSADAAVIGRDEECSALQSFLGDPQSDLLYICGPPGTGKSATASQFLDKTAQTHPKRRIVQLNCVSLKRPQHVYEALLEHLDTPGSTLSDLQTCLQTLAHEKEIVLVLDEIDFLLSADSPVLYSLFELHRLDKVKVIGIANALNLTDTLLPMLRASGCEPEILRFKPYSASAVTQILEARIATASQKSGMPVVVDRSALVFLGRKMANATGDIRKALDILRSAVELAEQEYRSEAALQPLSPVSNSSMNAASPSRKISPVTIKHVSRVTAAAMGGAAHASNASALLATPPSAAKKTSLNDKVVAVAPVTSTAQLIEHLSLHEKAALCTMLVRKSQLAEASMAASRLTGGTGNAKGRAGGVCVADLFQAYSELCKRDKMLTALPRAEFATVVSAMVDKGVLTLPGRSKTGHATAGRSRPIGLISASAIEMRVILGVAEIDILRGIGDIGILKRFFD